MIKPSGDWIIMKNPDEKKQETALEVAEKNNLLTQTFIGDPQDPFSNCFWFSKDKDGGLRLSFGHRKPKEEETKKE